MNAISEVEVTTASPLAAAAVLVEMNISVWGASRLDRDETERVNTAANAVSNAAQVRKDILAGSKLRKHIADYAAGCRMWHNRQTMPWSDKGMRLLPTSLFLDYKAEANARKAEFDALVQTFLTAYPTLVMQAAQNMGSLFDPSDYPDVSEIAAKFDFRMVFSPVPEAGDFRVNVGTEALQEMQESYASAFDVRLKAVTQEPWDRLHEMLQGMSDKMTEEEAPRMRKRKLKDGTTIEVEVKRPFHESFVSNAQDLCRMLGHLNVTGDPQLEKARLALESVIFNVDIDVVRESPEMRAGIKAKVDAILTQNDQFW